MPRKKTPKAEAKLTGALKNHPERFDDRPETEEIGGIGYAPSSFTARQKQAWKDFVRELPWLKRSDRAVLIHLSRLRARLEADDDPPLADVREFRIACAQLGGTPTTREKVYQPPAPSPDPGDTPAPAEEADPMAEFAGRPN